MPLVEQVIRCLAESNSQWDRVLEPTCGKGNFLRGILGSSILRSGGEIQGIEIQTAHLREAAQIPCDTALQASIKLIEASVFDLNLGTDLHWQANGRLLVIGNPPWVTNAELGSLASTNLPEKRNLKGLNGLDALTGASNFDIAEYIWLKLIRELAEEKPTIALLCKTSVARNVLQFAAKNRLPISQAYLRRIDSKKWFAAAVDSCLFVVEIGSRSDLREIPVYPDLTSSVPEQSLSMRDGKLIGDMEAYEESAAIDGVFPLTWRQGMKHDAASIMELCRLGDGSLQNKLGEGVSIEEEYVFPLLKSSDLFNGRITNSHRHVIVTQRFIGQDTADLETKAPKLWAYLNRHRAVFERRKSSIYIDKPPFSIFGVGDYAFSDYKVAISGLYKAPKFVAIGPIEGRPVMLDDTCYFVSCESAWQCAAISILLNSPMCQKFLSATSFADAKRPITKKLLQRIHLQALWEQADSYQLWEASRHLEAELSPNGNPTYKQPWATKPPIGDMQLSFPM
ncbi:MAG: SAM-dependent methyltransferase [Anaerolineae bacterium]|nr:SAM-dependent methyltransferase [Anaerolineae bacterium]